MALTADLRVKFSATQTAANDLGTPTFAPDFLGQVKLASGTGANQADLLWCDERTISASSSENLDLAGSLTDAFGATLTMVEVVAIIISASSGNTNDVVVGAAGSNPLPLFGGTSGTIAVRPGGLFVIAAPNAAGQVTVTAGTGDILKVANSSSGSSVTYKIMVVGRSA